MNCEQIKLLNDSVEISKSKDPNEKTWDFNHSSPCRKFGQICLFYFAMVVCEKIYLEKSINNQLICLKNTCCTVQLYFILAKAELHWILFSLHRDAPDIHRFPQCTWLRPKFCWKTCHYWGLPCVYWKKFEHSLAHSNIEYSCTIFFESNVLVV